MFVLAFMFMPIVNAEEIPREGVTYFLQYPDGSEDVKESYDEAITYPEKVIFEGTTDSNGQVTIEGLSNEGEIRVVQTVPDGYNTREEDIKVDLSQKREVQMTNTSKLLSVATNPKTGMSFILFIFVICLVIYTIKIKKNKKILTVIPVIIAVALISNVNAENSDFTVTVKDSLGNGLSNVPVKVYAKPVIDAAPAVKFDANGGHFFDGKTELYVRIPHNGCSWEDLCNSVSEDEWNYMGYNTYYNVYREGYYPDGMDEPDTLSNGTVIKNYWKQDSNARVLTIHGNGETIDLYGHEIEDFAVYYDDFMSFDSYNRKWNFDTINNSKELYDKYFGFSPSTSCENVPIGITANYRIEQLDYPSDVYLCFSDKQDGIYLNNELNKGNVDTCFIESYFYYNENNNMISASSDTYNYYISNLNDRFLNFQYPVYYGEQREHIPLNKIEIIMNGKKIVSVDSGDISSSSIDNFYISDIEKNNQVKEYINRLITRENNGQCPNICTYYGPCLK